MACCGFVSSNQGKYYNLEGHLLSDLEGANEPEYTQCRMGTNKADAFLLYLKVLVF